jgi:hypothetical protein
LNFFQPLSALSRPNREWNGNGVTDDIRGLRL